MYEQSDVLLSVCLEYEKAVTREGFEPHLDEILAEVKHLWSRKQFLPPVILSRTSTGIDYWEPSWNKTPKSLLAICFSLRNLLRLGASEFLYISELWTHQEPLAPGELLSITWLTQTEGRAHVCRIKRGKYAKYLHGSGQVWEPIDIFRAVNPILNPWHTTKDIFDFLGVPEADRNYDQLEELFRTEFDAFDVASEQRRQTDLSDSGRFDRSADAKGLAQGNTNMSLSSTITVTDAAKETMPRLMTTDAQEMKNYILQKVREDVPELLDQLDRVGGQGAARAIDVQPTHFAAMGLKVIVFRRDGLHVHVSALTEEDK